MSEDCERQAGVQVPCRSVRWTSKSQGSTIEPTSSLLLRIYGGNADLPLRDSAPCRGSSECSVLSVPLFDLRGNLPPPFCSVPHRVSVIWRYGGHAQSSVSIENTPCRRSAKRIAGMPGSTDQLIETIRNSAPYADAAPYADH